MAKKSKIRGAQIFGERNSGTNYLRKLMRDNYKDFEVLAGNKGFGWKHGDIGNPWKFYKENNKLFTHKIHDYKKEGDGVLFLVIYRNPFTWLQSMNNSPHHAPEMFNLNFSDFLRKKWCCYYGPMGADMDENETVRMSIVKPENLFEEYDNVLELRKDKIRIFESFPSKLKNVCFVRFEDLLKDPEKIIKKIAKIYGFELRGKFENITEDKFGQGKYKAKKYPDIRYSDYQFILNNLDWDLEKTAGYMVNPSKVSQGIAWWKRIFGKPKVDPRQSLDYGKGIYFRAYISGKKYE